VAVATDSAPDGKELADSLRRLATIRSGVTVTGTAPITVTSCG